MWWYDMMSTNSVKGPDFLKSNYQSYNEASDK